MKKKLMIIGSILLLLVIVLASAGFIYERMSYQNVENHYPPDGKMMNVEDREIHANIKGESTNLPPVLIETGTGNWSYDWFYLQDELAKHTQVITYDRSGYGWSSPPDDDFSLEATISDLNAIYEESKIESPAILLGHSVGGVYVRHFADTYPNKVAGLILVDSRNEFFKDDAPSAYHDEFFDSQDQMFNKILSRFGVIRLVGENTLAGMPDYISTKKYAQVQYDVPFFDVLDDEIKQIPENVERLKSLQPLQDKPLTIITPEEPDTQAVEFGFSEQETSEINQFWIDAQEKLTDLSTNSKLIEVSNSSHAVMYDQPEVIIDAVLDMEAEYE